MVTNNQRRIRVLVVDDSGTVRIAASKMFGQDFDVLLAVDGEDGLDVIENDNKIQVVFTDLVMPVMDGFELLKQIRTHKIERISSLPVIVMTGAENPEIAKQKALELGATDFVVKPFNPTDIRARAQSYAKLIDTTKELRQKTTIDELTNLLNFRGFKQQLEREIAFSERHKHNISVMTVEIDSYKELFISMGRTGTERLIKRIGEILVSTMRKEDTIARTGLARYCVSMPLTEKSLVMELANKICSNVERLKAILKGKRLKLTVSVGITHTTPDKPVTPDTLIDASGIALEEATQLGRSQLYLLTVEDYMTKYRVNGQEFSIDHLLEQIKKGEYEAVSEHLNEAVSQLAPLISLLSHEQKQRILTQRR